MWTIYGERGSGQPQEHPVALENYWKQVNIFFFYPGNISKGALRSSGSLAVSALTHVILDVTHRDAKNRTLLDIPETRDEVFKTVLGAPSVQKGIKEGKIQVVLF